MNEKDGSWDLSDLQKEIDSAVDNLLVKKKEQTNPVTTPLTTPQAQPPKNHLPAEGAGAADRPAPSASFAETTRAAPRELKEKFAADRPSASASLAETPKLIPRELKEKVEEVEAQLLTLEWDINSKNINSAITHLQDLRKYSHLGNELEKVIILIQKVLYQLILDESKLTPTALKFLQKSWKAVKGMTDERFSFEIDKGTLVKELIAEFQKLKIEEGALKEKARGIQAQRSLEERIVPGEAQGVETPLVNERISRVDLDNIMNKLEKLVQVVNEERKRWEGIYQEISNVKADLQRGSISKQPMSKKMQEETLELDQRVAMASSLVSNPEFQQGVSSPVIAISLCTVSGVIFGLPEKQIVRSFQVKKWVSDSFIERGKVKLKTREIPLFNIFKVFKLKPSTEENPLVLLIRGREDRPAAVIIDQALSREEMAYQPVEGRPYILGQGISRRGRVWILDAEQISP
jgi:hypothetical protein